MAALFSGVGLLKFTSDTNTATTPRESRFCDGRNISTIIVADLSTEETACDVILSEESALLEQQFVDFLEELSIHKEYYIGGSCW